MKILLTLLGASFALSNIGSAALLYQYQANPGSPNPSTQGWTAVGFGSGSGVSAGPISDSGTPAWFVDDKSTSNAGMYTVTPTVGDLTAAASSDWQLSTTLRVVNISDSPEGALMVLYRGNGSSYQMHFGSTSTGDAIVLLSDGLNPGTGASYTISGSGYHTYDLNYSQSTSHADLYVDNNLVGTPYLGFAWGGADEIGWGSGASVDTGRGNFASTSFSVSPVPEPSAAVVGLLCFLVFGSCRIRHLRMA